MKNTPLKEHALLQVALQDCGSTNCKFSESMLIFDTSSAIAIPDHLSLLSTGLRMSENILLQSHCVTQTQGLPRLNGTGTGNKNHKVTKLALDENFFLSVSNRPVNVFSAVWSASHGTRLSSPVRLPRHTCTRHPAIRTVPTAPPTTRRLVTQPDHRRPICISSYAKEITNLSPVQLTNHNQKETTHAKNKPS